MSPKKEPNQKEGCWLGEVMKRSFVMYLFFFLIMFSWQYMLEANISPKYTEFIHLCYGIFLDNKLLIYSNANNLFYCDLAYCYSINQLISKKGQTLAFRSSHYLLIYIVLHHSISNPVVFC